MNYRNKKTYRKSGLKNYLSSQSQESGGVKSTSRIAKRSPSELCQHWPNCEGCPFIGRPYPEQLNFKKEAVVNAFMDSGFDPQWTRRIVKSTRPSPMTLKYRNKAKWILEKVDGEIIMGMYRPGTHEILNMPHCAVHSEAINDLSQFIKENFLKFNVPVGPLDQENPTVRYLIVRYSFREKKLLVVFVTTSLNIPGLDRVIRALEDHEVWSKKVLSIVQNINNDSGNVLLGEANKFLKKTSELTETMGPFRVPVGPLSFLQVNSLQASYLYKRVRELLGPGPFESGLDLYSGVGLMAMHMASSTQRILAVEEVGPAALEAITAARRNKIQNILELCGDAIEGIQTFVSEWGTPDWVILNPPRKGCDERVLAALNAKMPKRLVYVSCNPQTLARDLQILLNGQEGLEIKAVEPVDMFPQTPHIECLVLVENKSQDKKKTDKPRRVRNQKESRPRSKAVH
jgi:23S rRNA (uracil1939-C5)-methyltransferase